MVRRGFENGSEGGSEQRGMMAREDEEGPDEGRWRCLNAFWAVGRRVAVSGGCSGDEKWMLDPENGKQRRGWTDVGGRQLKRPH
jgi:hypothetical protein